MRSWLTHNKSSPMAPSEPLHADIPQLHDAELTAVYYGQRQAGDFYDFFRVHPERVLFGLFDAAGGFQDTRSVITAAQHTFRTVGAELFSKNDVNESEVMIELCLQLNRTVLEAAQGIHACPAFAGCYNEHLGVVCYFNAGHTPGLVRDSTGVVELPATGLPLGLFSHTTSDAPMVALTPGAALLLVSRGVIESKHNGREFGLEQVKTAFQNTHAQDAQEICVSILDSTRQFMGSPPTHDDVTTLALVRARSSSQQ